MRFERFSPKIVENATTLLLQGYPFSKNEQLNCLRYLAEAAKENNMTREWHNFVNLIKHYEEVDPTTIDKIILKWITKLEIPHVWDNE